MMKNMGGTTMKMIKRPQQQQKYNMTVRHYFNKNNKQTTTTHTKAFKTFQEKQQQTFTTKQTKQNYQYYQQQKYNQWREQQQRQYNSQSKKIQQGMEWYKPVLGVVAAAGGFFVLNEMFNKNKGGTTLADEKSLMNAGITQFQRDILAGTYGYLATGLLFTAGAAIGMARTGIAAKYYSMNPFMQMAVGIGGIIGLSTLTRSISNENYGAKVASWLAFNTFFGLLLAPYLMFGPNMIGRAAFLTAGIFGGMTTIALTAEQERFLYLGGALYSALLVLILGSFTSVILPARFAQSHNMLHNVITYGSLALFTAFLLYDTQKILAHGRALEHTKPAWEYKTVKNPTYLHGEYINLSMRLYIDIINIFTSLMNLQGSRRR